MKKMWTLLKKDLWTSFTDKTIVLMLFTPVMLGIIFRIVTYDTWMILLTMSLFNLVLAPLCNFPLLITEEKDRGTLPLLFRSKVTVGAVHSVKGCGFSSHWGVHVCCRVLHRRGRSRAAASVSSDQPGVHGFFPALWVPDRPVRQRPEQCKCIQHTQCDPGFCDPGIFLLEPGVWQYRCIYPHQFHGNCAQPGKSCGRFSRLVPSVVPGCLRHLVRGRAGHPVCSAEKKSLFPCICRSDKIENATEKFLRR